METSIQKPIITDLDLLINSLTIEISWKQKALLKWLIPNAFRAVFGREKAKNYLVAATNALRQTIKGMGRELKRQVIIFINFYLFFYHFGIYLQ